MWSFVREERDRARKSHDVHLRAGFERGSLVVGQCAVSLLGVQEPGRDAGLGELPTSRTPAGLGSAITSANDRTAHSARKQEHRLRRIGRT